MQVHVKIESLTERLSQGLPPEVLLRRSPPADSPVEAYQAARPMEGEWWVPQNPLGSDLGWAVNRKTEVVRIPMFPYRLAKEALPELMLFGAQLSAALLLAAQQEFSGESLRQVFIVLSEVFSRDDGRPGYLVYAGAAFLL